MSIPLKVASIEEVDEKARKFVTEKDGEFFLDNDQLMAGQKAERNISDGLRKELAPFKALGMSAEALQALVDLGKPADELARMMADAAKPAAAVPDVTKSTEFLELKKQFESLQEFKQKYEAAEAENLKNKRNDYVRKAARGLPDNVDKDLLVNFLEESGMFDRFALNDGKDGLSPVGDKLPGDYLLDLANRYRFQKSSTPGIAKPGTATIPKNGGDTYAAAKESGNIDAMIAAAPILE